MVLLQRQHPQNQQQPYRRQQQQLQVSAKERRQRDVAPSPPLHRLPSYRQLPPQHDGDARVDGAQKQPKRQVTRGGSLRNLYSSNKNFLMNPRSQSQRNLMTASSVEDDSPEKSLLGGSDDDDDEPSRSFFRHQLLQKHRPASSAQVVPPNTIGSRKSQKPQQKRKTQSSQRLPRITSSFSNRNGNGKKDEHKRAPALPKGSQPKCEAEEPVYKPVKAAVAAIEKPAEATASLSKPSLHRCVSYEETDDDGSVAESVEVSFVSDVAAMEDGDGDHNDDASATTVTIIPQVPDESPSVLFHGGVRFEVCDNSDYVVEGVPISQLDSSSSSVSSSLSSHSSRSSSSSSQRRRQREQLAMAPHLLSSRTTSYDTANDDDDRSLLLGIITNPSPAKTGADSSKPSTTIASGSFRPQPNVIEDDSDSVQSGSSYDSFEGDDRSFSSASSYSSSSCGDDCSSAGSPNYHRSLLDRRPTKKSSGARVSRIAQRAALVVDDPLGLDMNKSNDDDSFCVFEDDQRQD